MATITYYIVYFFVLLICLVKSNQGKSSSINFLKKDFCDRLRRQNKAYLYPICEEEISYSTKTTRSLRRKTKTTKRISKIENEKSFEIILEDIHDCHNSDTLVQCKADSTLCPNSGQICFNTDNTMCCQNVVKAIPVSHIHSKPGNCPTPIGISMIQDVNVGCWLDQNCPGIQKCCLEPNPASNSATRLCRDPINIQSFSICNLPISVGICNAPTIRYYYDAVSGKCRHFQYSGCGGNKNNFQTLASCQANCGLAGILGNPECPPEANMALNCLFAHPDACKTDSDCMGRINTKQPSCCMSKCGYRICHQY
uniref:BPTI/Kunitz inhibitor domain-containing protein n=1 Tax=Parastrongyloides trichosuri TaxID=131310 RepID=A0A0N4Z5S3_PARTI